MNKKPGKEKFFELINALAEKMMSIGTLSEWKPPETISIFSVVELDGVEDLVNDNGTLYVFLDPLGSNRLGRVKQFFYDEGDRSDVVLNEKTYKFLGCLHVWEGGILCYGISLTEKIRRSLDYQGIGRSIVQVTPLPEGLLENYNNGFSGFYDNNNDKQ